MDQDIGELYNLAAAAFNNGVLSEAIDAWSKVIQLIRSADGELDKVNLAKVSVNLGNTYLRASQWSKAIDTYDIAIDECEERTAEIYHRRAICLRNLKREEEANQWDEAALDIDTSYFEARRSIVISYIQQQNWELAEAWARNAVEWNETDPNIALDLCFIFLKQKKPADAAAEASRIREELGDKSERAVKLHAAALAGVAEEYGALGDYEESASAWEGAADIEATESRIYNSGLMHMRAAERNGESTINDLHIQGAIQQFTKVTSMNPNLVQAHTGLGLVYLAANEPYQATLSFAKASTLNPNDYELQFNYGVALVKCNQHKESVPKFKKALSIKPDFVQAQKALEIVEAAIREGKEPDQEQIAPPPPPPNPEPARPSSPALWFIQDDRVPEDFEGVGGDMYTKTDLVGAAGNEEWAKVIDMTHREMYLSVKEFNSTFHMPKAEFYRLPKWRRNDLKRKARLF